MQKLKLNAFWLFILLLIVLILSFLYGSRNASAESFINFYGTTAANTANLTIPNYGNPIIKLYDNDFFDPINGNLLRVYGNGTDPKTPQDTKGDSIDHVDVLTRNGESTTFLAGTPITSGTLTTVPNSYQTWTVFSSDPKFKNITSNQIVYSAWGQDTYIHVLDLNNKLNAYGYLFSVGSASPNATNINTTLTKLNPPTTNSNYTSNPNNNQYMYDNTLNAILYQFRPHVFYSPLTGDLIIMDNKKNYNIFNRSGNSVSSISNKNISSSTTSWVQYDLVGNHMIIYAPNKTNTTIILLHMNTDGITYKVTDVGRFSSDGSLHKDANNIVSIPTGIMNSANMSPPPVGNTQIDGKSTSAPPLINVYDNDYILKTQIIPPVCPACPACPSFGGTCTTCGNVSAPSPVATALDTNNCFLNSFGNLIDRDGHILANNVSTDNNGNFKDSKGNLIVCPYSGNGKGVSGTPSAYTSYTPSGASGGTTSGTTSRTTSESKEKGLLREAGSGTANLLRDTGSGTKNLIEDTASGTVGLAKEAVGGTVGLAKEAVGGTVGLAKEAVGGTVGLAKEAVGGTVGLAKEAVGGAAGLLRDTGKGTAGLLRDAGSGIAGQSPGQGQPGSVGYYAQGVQPQGPQNPFTYNGALTDKPASNFIPLTADFSKFGR